MFNFDEANKKSKETIDGVLKSYTEVAKGFQAIATEAGDYSRKSFQDASTYLEALIGSRSIEAAYEVQTKYFKSSYEGFVAEASKLGEMYADLAKAAYKPYEAAVPPAPPVKSKSTAVAAVDAA